MRDTSNRSRSTTSPKRRASPRPTSAASSGAPFGEPPYTYLLTRRLERAAALLRNTDYSVAEVCLEVGLQGVGSFTTSFKRMYGATPTAYRAAATPASAHARVPACIVRAYARPQHRTFREDSGSSRT
jgi:AraC-like DNA-binding protein